MCKFLKILKVGSLFALLVLSRQAIAQTTADPYTPDTRLSEVMSKDYLQQLSNERSELILYYNYYLENSFIVLNLNQEKQVSGIDIHTVNYSRNSGKTGLFDESSFNANTFNVLKYDFPTNLEKYTTYVWKEAGVALVFYPARQLETNFKNYLKNSIED